MVGRKCKTLCVLILCALVSIYGTVICNAAPSSYRISEIDDMVIVLPDNMTAATRSSKNTDKYFSVFGLNYETIMQNFKSSDIYLQGMDSSSSLTLTVTMTKTSDSQSIGNYNMLSQDKLAGVKNNFINQNEFISCTQDQAENIVWLSFNANVTSNGRTIKAYQSNTVYDGMSVNITLQRNEGNVTAKDYETFSNIVSSVTFLKAGSSNSVFIYILIGVCAAAVIVIILSYIMFSKAKKLRKHSKNDKIIKELSNKYNVKNDTLNINNTDKADTFESNDSSDDFILNDYNDTETPKTAEAVNFEQTEEKTEEYIQAEEEEFDNDEELLRQQAREIKFSDSDDFFEEAPKKTMGVISSADIQNAEDYDVINEVEKRVSQVESENTDRDNSFAGTLKSVCRGFKSFGIHLGYFCTNLSRMIKRKIAANKRRKMEEERRERAKMRAAREERQMREMQEGGLVRVHSRNERRTQTNVKSRRSGAQYRRSSQRKYPQSSTKNNKRR